jgi:hypothetical protein
MNRNIRHTAMVTQMEIARQLAQIDVMDGEWGTPGWIQTRTAEVLAGTPWGDMDSIRRWRLLDEQKSGIVHDAFGLAGVCDPDYIGWDHADQGIEGRITSACDQARLVSLWQSSAGIESRYLIAKLVVVLVEVEKTKEVEKAVAEHSYHPDTTLFVQANCYENILELALLALEAGADKAKLLSIFEAVANASVGEHLRRYRPMRGNHLIAELAGLATQVVAAVSAAVLRPSLVHAPTNQLEVIRLPATGEMKAAVDQGYQEFPKIHVHIDLGSAPADLHKIVDGTPEVRSAIGQLISRRSPRDALATVYHFSLTVYPIMNSGLIADRGDDSWMLDRAHLLAACFGFERKPAAYGAALLDEWWSVDDPRSRSWLLRQAPSMGSAVTLHHIYRLVEAEQLDVELGARNDRTEYVRAVGQMHMLYVEPEAWLEPACLQPLRDLVEQGAREPSEWLQLGCNWITLSTIYSTAGRVSWLGPSGEDVPQDMVLSLCTMLLLEGCKMGKLSMVRALNADPSMTCLATALPHQYKKIGPGMLTVVVDCPAIAHYEMLSVLEREHLVEVVGLRCEGEFLIGHAQKKGDEMSHGQHLPEVHPDTIVCLMGRTRRKPGMTAGVIRPVSRPLIIRRAITPVEVLEGGKVQTTVTGLLSPGGAVRPSVASYATGLCKWVKLEVSHTVVTRAVSSKGLRGLADALHSAVGGLSAVDAQLAVSERLPIEEFMSYYQVQGPYSCYGQYNVDSCLPAGPVLDLPALVPQEGSKLYLTPSRVARGMLRETLYHGHPLYDVSVETVSDAAPGRLQEAKVVAIGAGPSRQTR